MDILEKKTHATHIFLSFVSLTFTFENECCPIIKINGRSGNEPKPFHPALLYNAKVFLFFFKKIILCFMHLFLKNTFY